MRRVVWAFPVFKSQLRETVGAPFTARRGVRRVAHFFEMWVPKDVAFPDEHTWLEISGLRRRNRVVISLLVL